MAEIVKFVEVNPKYNRAVALVKDDKDLFFGLVIKRTNPESGQLYTCIYCSLTLPEYELLIKHPNEDLSFLGIANTLITVGRPLADVMLMEQPQHYAGIHLSVEITSQLTRDDVVIRLEAFCTEIRHRIREMRAENGS